MEEVFLFLNSLSEICDVLSIPDNSDYKNISVQLPTYSKGNYVIICVQWAINEIKQWTIVQV